jgi:hypothetical protein
MKFFLDSADVDQIRRACGWGVVDGVTTNPSLVAKAGQDFKQTITDICETVDGPVYVPYALPGEPPEQWPRVSGVHGVFRHLDDHVVGGKLVTRGTKMFDKTKLDALRKRQVDAVRYLDTVVEELFDTVPENTYITITSDHGELFGEDGYFGHGPILHDKVFEVFLVEGKLR